MLSKTPKNSPIRMAAGIAGLGALSLAALGLTASGTQAAEKIRNKVETTIGVELGQDMPEAPSAPPAPPAQPAAAAAPAPAAPPAPPAEPEAPRGKRHVYSFSNDGPAQDGKQIRKIVMVHANGETREVAMPDMDAIRISVPEIRDGKCGKEGKATVEHRTDGGKKIMIICSDRIAALSADAEAMALRHKKFGMASAMAGLRHARRSIENEQHMTADERAKALKGIDEAMAELEKERSSED